MSADELPRRGDLIAWEVERSITYAGGATKRRTVVLVGAVSSVSRDGITKAAKSTDGQVTTFDKPYHRRQVGPSSKVDVFAFLEEHGRSEFSSFAAVVAACRPYMRNMLN